MCSRCGVGPAQHELAGTGRAFCEECRKVVADVAAYLGSKGATDEEVLADISRRWDRGSQNREKVLQDSLPLADKGVSSS
jgi:hypothetical protein